MASDMRPALIFEDELRRLHALMEEHKATDTHFRGRPTVEQRLLAGIEDELSSKAQRVLEGLTPKQRTKLSELVFDSCDELGRYKIHSGYVKQLSKVIKEAARRQRMLDSKLKSARSSLEKMRDYASALDPRQSRHYLNAANDCLHRLDLIGGPMPIDDYQHILETTLEFAPTYTQTDDPADYWFYTIFNFLKNECGRGNNESEVRVGLINNEIWTKPEIGRKRFDSLRLENEIGESKGCTAVRQRVNRYMEKNKHK